MSGTATDTYEGGMVSDHNSVLLENQPLRL
jgi:hypothetical protein